MIPELFIYILVRKLLLRRNNCMICLKLRNGLDGQRFEFQQGQENCLFSKIVNTRSGAHQVFLNVQRLPRCNVRTFDCTHATDIGAPYDVTCIKGRYTLAFWSLLVTWCTTSLTFNNCTLCPHCIYVFCIYLRTNSDLCHLEHKLIGFYNRDEKCLQGGTARVFK
jgi:hypothetical protein